jgi:hypothetical protein
MYSICPRNFYMLMFVFMSVHVYVHDMYMYMKMSCTFYMLMYKGLVQEQGNIGERKVEIRMRIIKCLEWLD